MRHKNEKASASVCVIKAGHTVLYRTHAKKSCRVGALKHRYKIHGLHPKKKVQFTGTPVARRVAELHSEPTLLTRGERAEFKPSK